MNKIKIFSVVIALGMIATSCQKKKDLSGTYKGPEVDMGHGKAYAWIKFGNDTKAMSFGITLTKQALEHLPEQGQGHDHMMEYVLDFPEEAGAIPFRHALVNWNPEGHEPAGIYDVPHFDFHFYTISAEQRKQIPLWEADSTKFKNVPGPAFFPTNYMYLGGGVPQMGAHLIDITSPELHGNPFKETFIYGSYNGAVIFLETMVEKNFFQAAQLSRAVPRPEKVQQQGLYPKRYRIVKDENSYSIIFDELEYRPQ